jgi:hypothetical protein
MAKSVRNGAEKGKIFEKPKEKLAGAAGLETAFRISQHFATSSRQARKH